MRAFLQIAAVLFLSITLTTLSQARSKRVSQIPNGSKFGCANCHINPNGGGARNAFGQAVQNGFLDGNGDVTWNASLAGLDSDGDGVSNGAELQDANGTWNIGESQPGSVDLVSNPGDASSTTDVAELLQTPVPDVFNLAQNYPNPFNPETKIRFILTEPGFVTLAVFNVLGQKVKTLVSQQAPAGIFSVNWDGTDEFGYPVRSGVYLYRIQTEHFRDAKRMILMK